MKLATRVKVVDATCDDWKQQVASEINTRKNFVIILKSSAEAEKLSEMLHCQTPPQRLERFGIYALADVLHNDDYIKLIDIHTRCDVRFVEQLHLATSRPPDIKPFILYCELRGIISDHETFEGAGRQLCDYLDQFNRAKLFPLAGIYQFKEGMWKRVRAFMQ